MGRGIKKKRPVFVLHFIRTRGTAKPGLPSLFRLLSMLTPKMDLQLRTMALALGRCFLIVLIQAHDTIAQEQQRKSDQQWKLTAPKV